ncbi:hypothetical protein [Streptomyces sp. LN590]|uniref:hypothetical protein n=1 Tax=unclassified Streptomyces TaxID=2593676 RepID=UPI003721C9C0
MDRIDEAIAAAEQRERERQQGEERRPPTPDWIVELSIGVGARPIEVHVGVEFVDAQWTAAVRRGRVRLGSVLTSGIIMARVMQGVSGGAVGGL